ncbi:Aste57867_12366 [Aphanomyces stellatus]|uniref:Aste57867_12366 protein n=1 Tax=Aphanomyces stellatus TaxID=120398 RepID=A0A485KVC1_9STRA|nr:hypothetical protein As57867_012320 [Aphanomyces stellatus]VFT89218.1 Aste57867_12366 [Aphanomyces stellatus]
MKFVASLLALSATATVAQDDGIRVIGGSEADVGKYTWAVNLRNSPAARSFCGGSLIAPQYVLTAGHCVAGNKPPFVAIGSHFNNGTDDGQQIAVEWAKAHPQYRDTTKGFDVAILKLVEPSTFDPIKLKRDFINGGDDVRLLGWGRTAYPGDASHVLKEIDIKAIEMDECTARLSQSPYYPNWVAQETHLCAGGEVDKAACHGDSGGPLIVVSEEDDEESYALVGDVSAGHPCGKGFPDLFGRVSAVADFIDETSEGHEWV